VCDPSSPVGYANVEYHLPWIDNTTCALTDTYVKRCTELYRPTPVDYANGEVAEDAFCIKALQCMDGLVSLLTAPTTKQVEDWIKENCCQDRRLPSNGYIQHVWSMLESPPCSDPGESCAFGKCCALSGLVCSSVTQKCEVSQRSCAKEGESCAFGACCADPGLVCSSVTKKCEVPQRSCAKAGESCAAKTCCTGLACDTEKSKKGKKRMKCVKKVNHMELCAKRCTTYCLGKQRVNRCAAEFINHRCKPFSDKNKVIVKGKCLAMIASRAQTL
jgi:hypothetical protein